MKRFTEKSLLPNASDFNHKFYGEGAAYFKKGDFKNKNCFRDSIEYWSQDPQAWFALGDCFYELKNHQELKNVLENHWYILSKRNTQIFIII